jgi:hypothetical protein
MRYFTPERLVRLGNLDDRDAFLAAHEDWERAVGEYQEQLRQIGPELPPGLRQLTGAVYLHDARVLDMWWGGRSQFTITLHPESDPSRLVVLSYSLSAPPEVKGGVLPESILSQPVAWLYDELDHAGDRFTHDILLSDGREIRLHFRTVTVKRPVPLVPAGATGPALSAPVRDSA